MDYSALDFLTGSCELATLVDAWMYNPLPFPITISTVSFNVYFHGKYSTYVVLTF